VANSGLIDISHLSPAQRREAAAIVRELERRRARNKLKRYIAYPKQQEFHHLAVRERLLMASNRFGKTECGAAEMAMHLRADTLIGGKASALQARSRRGRLA